MKMFKLAVFDLDGTLVNSIFDLADAVNTALSEKGYPVHETDEYYFMVGNGAKKLCERALPEDRRTEEEIVSLQRRFSEAYSQNCLNKTRPYEGMPELVKRLREAGIMCAVASNKPDSFSGEIVAALFPEVRFDLVRGKRDGVPTKPQPQIVYNIAAELGADLAQAVFIGDSCVDVQTAHNAGLPCIGCVWGFRGEAELKANNCEYIAQTPDDIFRIIAGG